MSEEALATHCYKGNVADVKKLLDEGTAITFPALQNAVSTGGKSQVKSHRAVSELLFAAGADPNMSRPPQYASIIQVAAGGFSPEILRMVIEAGARLTDGQPLHAAVGQNSPENIQLLLEAGADVNATLPPGPHLPADDPLVGMTPLQYARHLRKKKAVEALEKWQASKSAKP